MVLLRKDKHITATLIDSATLKNEPLLYTTASNIENAGQCLFTTRSFSAGEPIAWYSGPVHAADVCENSDYCAGLAASWHVQGENICRYSNDAKGSKFKTNARMEWMAKDDTNFAYPFLLASRDISIGDEIFFSYHDKYWRNRHFKVFH